MKTIILIFVLLFTELISNAQHFITTDLGNSILLRPNLGYEYRWKKQSVGTSLQWQRNAMFWLTEFPSIIKTKGVRLDLSYKYFVYHSLFIESKIRSQTFKAPDYLGGWHTLSLYNSRNSVEIAGKIGLLLNKSGRFQYDLSAGMGYSYQNKNLQISDQIKYDGTKILSEEEVLAKFPYKKTTEWAKIPHAQLRVLYKIK